MAARPSPNASTPQWPGGDDTRPRPEALLATPLPFAEGPLTVRYQPDAVLGAGGMASPHGRQVYVAFTTRRCSGTGAMPDWNAPRVSVKTT
jgi:hypothetical protein